MPIITVKSIHADNKLELCKFAEDLSNATGIAVNRLQIMAEYFSVENFLTDGVDAIIHIAPAGKNGKELTQALMKACVTAAAKQFHIEENRIAVYVHPIETGYLLVEGKFV